MSPRAPRRSPNRRPRRGFGRIRQRSSGRYQAGYVGPDLKTHYAPSTFEAEIDAQGWLHSERRLIERDEWTPPATRHARRHTKGQTVAEYAEHWLATHRKRDGSPMRPRTVAHYRKLLDGQIVPYLGDVEVRRMTPERVEEWFADLDPDKPTLRAHAYALLRTMMGSATRGSRPLLKVNPCQLSGAGSSRRKHEIHVATLDELGAVAAAMPEKYRLMVLLAAWCGLRFGELAELRRKDLALSSKTLKVSRGVVKTGGGFVVGPPKSEAGKRAVAIPPHLMPLIAEHLERFAEPGRDGLLFPAAQGGHLSQSTLYKSFDRARRAAGRPDLRFHDLRHTGAVLAAATGATLAELMGRLGHSTPGAAMIYQHAARDRDREIAELLSKMAEGTKDD